MSDPQHPDEHADEHLDDRPDERPVESTQDYAAESVAAELVQVLDQYMADLKTGKAPDREALLSQHPHLASQLDACLAGIEFIHSTGAGEQPTPRQLGDFRILREVGRGGMGAVYEAEQISLGRRVALKVLRFGAVSDPQAIERFQREAETVATLHHTNIVPVFSVGSEKGVNFYAMQFIEGRSLADVARDNERPVDADTITQWGLQAAEALAHAHQRQVIHRDVKPSNLLIDDDGRIWLTDFGLAKRLDDVTLSMTGALLGTPRYMSPEQAAAAGRHVDHRTDIYSLGATLYELATGQPVFTADTPHGVIGQILSEEPLPPHKHRPDLPRDLETILLKCLHKDPAQRYASASDLANDLRACLEGRPIAARRVTVVQRSIKWARRQKKGLTIAASAVAATLLLILGGASAMHFWQRSKLAHVTLTTGSPPLAAQFVDEEGAPRAAPITVPTQQPVEIPAGEARLQVAGPGRFRQTYLTSLSPGRKRELDVSVLDQIQASINGVEAYGLIEFADGTDCVVATEQGITRYDAASGKPLWTVELENQGQQGPPVTGTTDGAAIDRTETAEAAGPGQLWPWQRDTGCLVQGRLDPRPGFLPKGIDLNADGQGDVVFLLRHQACLVALSGEDGQPLWAAARGSTVEKWPNTIYDRIPGSVLGLPQVVEDLDDDEVPDLIATFIDMGTSRRVEVFNPQADRWVEAISGATGRTIWRYDLSAELFELPDGADPPYAYRWFCGCNWSLCRACGTMLMKDGGSATRSERPWMARGGEFAYAPDAARVVSLGTTSAVAERKDPHSQSERQRSVVACAAGSNVVLLDLKTGTPTAPPHDLGIAPAAAIRWTDVDGDQTPELILLEELSPSKTTVFGPEMSMSDEPAPEVRIVVWSLTRQKCLWQRTLRAFLPHQPRFAIRPPSWPIVADLDHDGHRELLFPSDTSVPEGSRDFTSAIGHPRGVLEVVDAKTGTTQWKSQIPTMDQQIDRFLVGPDVNRDGCDEVFVVGLWSVDGFRHEVHVDCLSGDDGTTLWRRAHQVPRRNTNQGAFFVASLSWWQKDDDGWPGLVVQVIPPDIAPIDDTVTFVLSPATGKVVTSAPGICDLHRADVDGDHLDELISFSVDPGRPRIKAGRLDVVRAVGSDRWRRISRAVWKPAADLDGDGAGDLLFQSGGLAAVSSRTGRRLWNSKDVQGRSWTDETAPPGAWGDLTGDGISDLLIFASTPTHVSRRTRPSSPLVAVCGSTGRKMWSLDITVLLVGNVMTAEVKDLDGDDKPEVVFIASLDLGIPGSEQNVAGVKDGRLWAFVLDGRTGGIRWRQPLMAAYCAGTPGGPSPYELQGLQIEPAYADLNADGTLDVVIPAEADGRQCELQLRALSGRDGSTLWQRDLPVDRTDSAMFLTVPPAVAADLNADGKPEIVALQIDTHSETADQPPVAKVVALDGATGTPGWSWQMETKAKWGVHDTRSTRPKPVLLRNGDAPPYVAVKLPGEPQWEIVVLDADGHPVTRHTGTASPPRGTDFHFWPCDVDNDGRDELVVYDSSELRVLRAAQRDPLWTREIDTLRFDDVLGVYNGVYDGVDKMPATIVLRRRGDDFKRVEGLFASTGELRWSCPAPITKHVEHSSFWRDCLLSPGTGSAGPSVFYAYYGAHMSRRATLIEEESAATPHVADVVPTSFTVARDPRLLRQLPWVREFAHGLEFRPQALAWASLFSIAFVILPGGYTGWLVWRRRWGIRVWLCLPVFAMLVLTAWKTSLSTEPFDNLPERWGAALVMSPVVIALIGSLVLAARRRWRPLLAWLGVLILATVAVAVVFFMMSPGTLPGERYSLAGWYYVLYPAVYITACAMLFVTVVFAIVQRLRRRTAGGAPNQTA